MATPKKKHLIELMIEAGVEWPKGAEYAAQDRRNLKVNFYKNGKPDFQSGYHEWMANYCYFMDDDGVTLPELCRNWNKTIVTREQYAEAVAAANTSGKTNQGRESDGVPPSKPSPKYCASVMRQMPDNTIEQLADDYHAKAAEADRLQAVADEALKAADDALIALEKAGELIGLVISIDTKQKSVVAQSEPEQPIITDWRDLRIGDVVCFDGVDGEWDILNLEAEYDEAPIKVSEDIHAECTAEGWVNILSHPWRFIRRQ